MRGQQDSKPASRFGQLKSPLEDRHKQGGDPVKLGYQLTTSILRSANPGRLTGYLRLSLYLLFLPELGWEAESYLLFQWGSLGWALSVLETWILKDKERWGLKLRHPSPTPHLVTTPGPAYVSTK